MSRMSARTLLARTAWHSPAASRADKQRRGGHRVCVHPADHVRDVRGGSGTQPGHHRRSPGHAGRKLRRRSRCAQGDVDFDNRDQRSWRSADTSWHLTTRLRWSVVVRNVSSSSAGGATTTKQSWQCSFSATSGRPRHQSCACMNETYNLPPGPCRHDRQRRGGRRRPTPTRP